jgi:hypothetical protein
MERTRTNGMWMTRVLVAALISASMGLEAAASPPACDPSPAGLFGDAHSVVLAEVQSAKFTTEGQPDSAVEQSPAGTSDEALRDWTSRQRRIFLTTRYRVVDVFKGTLKPHDAIELASSCLNAPIPEAYLGYEIVEDFCPGDSRPPQVGIVWVEGAPHPAVKKRWILFLEGSDDGWDEISSTTFASERCLTRREDLTPEERIEFDRMLRVQGQQ